MAGSSGAAHRARDVLLGVLVTGFVIAALAALATPEVGPAAARSALATRVVASGVQALKAQPASEKASPADAALQDEETAEAAPEEAAEAAPEEAAEAAPEAAEAAPAEEAAPA